MSNNTLLLTLMIVLIAFIVLLTVLGIVFIVALRKRAPVVKVVMTGDLNEPAESDEEEEEEESPNSSESPASDAPAATGDAPLPEDVPVPEPEEEEDDDEEEIVYVTEGQERVNYNRSLQAKLCQLPDAAKEWYSQLKNELLSYDKIKSRMSWRHEAFRFGRMTVARLVVRGKTLCLLLAVEPAGYNGTKFSVEDVSNVARLTDTPTMYRIKSLRRLKYAKEMIAGIMKELKFFKNMHYIASDYYMPYEGDMALMQRGLVKRVVSGTTRTFKVEDVTDSIKEEAAASNNAPDNTQDEFKGGD